MTYLADISTKTNELNLSLQGKNDFIFATSIQCNSGFGRKMKKEEILTLFNFE
jgi:hypothetical protein